MMYATWLGEWGFGSRTNGDRWYPVALGKTRGSPDYIWTFGTQEEAEAFERRYNAGDTTDPTNAIGPRGDCAVNAAHVAKLKAKRGG